MITALATLLQLDVIAEGIETNEQLDFLLQTGCKEGQGYLFSRPIPYEKIDRLLFKEMQ